MAFKDLALKETLARLGKARAARRAERLNLQAYLLVERLRKSTARQPHVDRNNKTTLL